MRAHLVLVFESHGTLEIVTVEGDTPRDVFAALAPNLREVADRIDVREILAGGS